MAAIIDYQPRAPTYAPAVYEAVGGGHTPVWKQDDEPWIIPEVETRSIGTQYDPPPKPKKKKSRQWKLTNLYRKALEKYWLNANNKKKLRKILMDIYEDKNVKWTMARETKLISVLDLIKRKEKNKQTSDEQILKWVKGTRSMLKKRFNKRKLK
tara:strand:- start:14635 stop:15096 length:462 start_codon:yes stop_codon:yes gene_type:complete